jgi:hypothetical protein
MGSFLAQRGCFDEFSRHARVDLASGQADPI